MKSFKYIPMVFACVVSSLVSAAKPLSSSQVAGPVVLPEELMDTITAGTAYSEVHVQAFGRSPDMIVSKTATNAYVINEVHGEAPTGDSLQKVNPGAQTGDSLQVANNLVLPISRNEFAPVGVLSEWQGTLATTRGLDRFGWLWMATDFDSTNINTVGHSPNGSINIAGHSRNSSINTIGYSLNVLKTGGDGVAVVKGGNFAFAQGSSISFIDSTGVSVSGKAMAFGDRANVNISVSTRVIDTGRVQIGIGLVKTVACCGRDADTSVQAEAFRANDSSFSHVEFQNFNTAQASLSYGSAITLRILPP